MTDPLPRLADSPIEVEFSRRWCRFPIARRREWTYHSVEPVTHSDYFDTARMHRGFLYNNETGLTKCPGVADFYADTWMEAREKLT